MTRHGITINPVPAQAYDSLADGWCNGVIAIVFPPGARKHYYKQLGEPDGEKHQQRAVALSPLTPDEQSAFIEIAEFAEDCWLSISAFQKHHLGSVIESATVRGICAVLR